MKDLSQELLKIANKLAALGTPEEEAKARAEEAKDPFMQGLRQRMDPKMKGLQNRVQDMRKQEQQKASEAEVDKSFTAYAQAALFTGTDEEGEPLDKRFTVNDIHPDSKKLMRKDLSDFIRQVKSLYPGVDFDSDDLAHNFWLTRNREGSGFWDGDWPDNGEKLTALSHKFGEKSLLEDHEGELHYA